MVNCGHLFFIYAQTTDWIGSAHLLTGMVDTANTDGFFSLIEQKIKAVILDWHILPGQKCPIFCADETLVEFTISDPMIIY